jgi:hypothetical protein
MKWSLKGLADTKPTEEGKERTMEKELEENVEYPLA